jgi:type I restriction enzyme S subunit
MSSLSPSPRQKPGAELADMNIKRNPPLPEDWIYKPIPELIGEDGVFIDGDWVESKDQDPNGEIRLIQLADVGDGYYRDKSARFLTAKKAAELNCTFLEKGDVLIARMPEPLGRACIFPGDDKRCVTVVDVCIVRTGSNGASHRWLMHFVNSPRFRSEILSMQKGSTRKRISRGNLAKLSLPVPSSEEQNLIADEVEMQFTRLDAGIAALKHAQAELKRYRAAVLKAACEGKQRLISSLDKKSIKTTFGSICRVQGGYAFKSTEYKTQGIPLVRISNLIDGKVSFPNGTVFLPEQCEQNYSAFLLKKGDLLIAMSGATTGKMAVYDNDKPALLNQRVGRFLTKPQEICKSGFLPLLVEQVKGQVLKEAYGMAQPNISSKEIEDIEVFVPPINEQDQIVVEVERRLSITDNLTTRVETNLQRAARLRQAILKQAFEGNLING